MNVFEFPKLVPVYDIVDAWVKENPPGTRKPITRAEKWKRAKKRKAARRQRKRN